jgi:hypothetical protein
MLENVTNSSCPLIAIAIEFQMSIVIELTRNGRIEFNQTRVIDCPSSSYIFFYVTTTPGAIIHRLLSPSEFVGYYYCLYYF